jgi:hypothetical protein
MWTSVALGVVLTAAVAHAQTTHCTQLDGYAAEKVASYIDSWKDMHYAFKEFSQCDDGSVAEGFSEADARLMADHWPSLSEGLTFLRTDSVFERFVIRHLDETVANADLLKIDQLARTACPVAAKNFCAEVHAHLKLSGCSPKFPEGVGCPSSDVKPVRKPD